MSIGPIGSALTTAVRPVTPTTPTTAAASAAPTASATGAGFASLMSQGLNNLQALQNTADGLAVQAATGNLQDIHNYTIAATEASVANQLTVAVRNKAVDAFNEIMRMPL